MAKGKAGSLDEVLEIARARRQSGMLTIEHTQGGRLEEGELYLQAGQPVYARVGQLVGQDALNWLLQWHNIFFTISPEAPRQPAAVPAAGNGNSAVAVPAPPTSSSKSSPLSSNSPTGLSSEPGSGETSGLPRTNSYSPGIEWLVPQKRAVEKDVLSLPLTRRQRFIYFLVDGHRTISDLARCTGKNIQEVELTLSELQEQGLVVV